MARTVSIPPHRKLWPPHARQMARPQDPHGRRRNRRSRQGMVRAPEATALKDTRRIEMEDEIADVLQTVANLCTAFDISDLDLKNALQRCCARHYMRGRVDEHA